MWVIDKYPHKPLQLRIFVLQLFPKLCPVSMKCYSENFEIGSLPIQVHMGEFEEYESDSPPYLTDGRRHEQLTPENQPLLQRLFDEHLLYYPESVSPIECRIVDRKLFFNALDIPKYENSWVVWSPEFKAMSAEQRMREYVSRVFRGLV